MPEPFHWPNAREPITLPERKLVRNIGQPTDGGIMATWGEFIADIEVIRVKPHGMVVAVEQVMDLWEERNRLRLEVARLQTELGQEREGCAREIEEFAEACEAESEESGFIATALRAAANLLRERGETEPAAEEEESPPTVPPPAEPAE